MLRKPPKISRNNGIADSPKKRSKVVIQKNGGYTYKYNKQILAHVAPNFKGNSQKNAEFVQKTYAKMFRTAVTVAIKKNEAHKLPRNVFSSRFPKCMENRAPLPKHNPRITEVRNVISVKDEPTAARAFLPSQ